MKVQFNSQNNTIIAYGDFISGNDVYDISLNDYSPELYNYTSIINGVFNPNGFTLIPTTVEIGPNKRQENIDRMNAYMRNLVTQGELSQANFELFIADTLLLSQGYILESGRLFTFIETLNRNGYNATTIGFKTRPYRTINGQSIASGNYPRANDILVILNDL